MRNLVTLLPVAFYNVVRGGDYGLVFYLLLLTGQSRIIDTYKRWKVVYFSQVCHADKYGIGIILSFFIE